METRGGGKQKRPKIGAAEAVEAPGHAGDEASEGAVPFNSLPAPVVDLIFNQLLSAPESLKDFGRLLCVRRAHGIERP